MSDIIQLLPDFVANQIAAGEVIQRPASVVKELMENSIDAGAKKIDVIIVDAGKTLVQVVDDGKGMSETDARLSFERHATSKIHQADDLYALHTMGFRGEALASIAAVAKIDLQTKQEEDDLGTRLVLSGSEIVSHEACSCSVGCNFKVENLFYNVPARRKFLKSNTTELNNIVQAFERIVLVYPEVAFTLYHNGSEMFNLKSGSYRQRIVDVFGKRINQSLLPIEKIETSMCTLHGFVGKPESAKKKGSHQFFFVNSRYMRHAYFHKAIMSAFERLVPIGEQVSYFIYFEVPAENIDVNIHPTKTEIKFENEQPIWQILSAAVKESIGLFSDVPSIDFDTSGRVDMPVFNQGQAEEPLKSDAPKVEISRSYNPFLDAMPKAAPISQDWQQLYSQEPSKPVSVSPISSNDIQYESKLSKLSACQDDEEELFKSKVDSQIHNDIFDDKSPVHYQYKGKYIMTSVKSGLMIIDQHRAHVRVLYEKYMNQIRERKFSSQKTLFPETIDVPAADIISFEKVLPELQNMGFELTPFGRNSYAINAIPAGLDGINIVDLVNDMIASALESDCDVLDDIYHSLSLSLARNAAIPEGQVLSNLEMEGLVDDLFSCSDVKHTPDGKNIIGVLRQSDIERLFS
ncbi:MAG: DNA mismatch repair endonuclease MutL [Prevotella sp.]|nr:DNA mismatch repair endonuclease MutL [Prevotella sp.]